MHGELVAVRADSCRSLTEVKFLEVRCSAKCFLSVAATCE